MRQETGHSGGRVRHLLTISGKQLLRAGSAARITEKRDVCGTLPAMPFEM
jgi:hypothetical protein